MGDLVYNHVPIPVMAVMVGLALFATTEAAWAIAHKRQEHNHETPFDIALAPAFTLVALLLGFVFSMALQRYDARTNAVLVEANAIHEASLLSDLLEPVAAGQMRELLREYTDARLNLALADANPTARAEARRHSDEIQERLRKLVMGASAGNPSSGTIPLVVSALTTMTSLSAAQDAVLSAYIPPAVMVMLILISLLASGLMGFRLGCQGHNATMAGAMLALMTALILGTVIDLDQPQRGFIRVDLTPLHAARTTIAP